MKVSEEKRIEIRERYLELLNSGLTKTEARAQVSEECNVGKTTVYDHSFDIKPGGNIEDLEFVATEYEYPGAKTYILTAWDLRIAVDYDFVSCLRQMAKDYDAELLLTVCSARDLQYLPNELRGTFRIVTDDIEFNNNLLFKFVETYALAQSPLSGWRGFSNKTAILPGLVRELETQASVNACKQLISTGSVGRLCVTKELYNTVLESPDELYKKHFLSRWAQLNRVHGKTTALANEYIKPSALIVHVLNDELFLTRYVTMETAGVVYDLNRKYEPGQKAKFNRPLGLNVGDTHAYYADPTAVQATLEMLAILRPREVFLNDFTDGVSVNYHEMGRAQTFHEAPSINEEVEITKELLERFVAVAKRFDVKMFYLASNHDDFFEKFLDLGERMWRLNYNYDTAIKLQHSRKETGKTPIELLLDFNSLGVEYITPTATHLCGKVHIEHGHKLINGKRVGFKTQAQYYNYLSMNHTHSPSVFRNAVCGGLTAKMNMPYVERSISGWLHANTLIHEDGSMQLLPIIEGSWKL